MPYHPVPNGRGSSCYHEFMGKQRKEGLMITAATPMLDRKQVAKMLHVSESTLWGWVKQRRIPFVRIGSMIRFEPDKLEKWIKSKTQEATA
jgi:excisionase family DNA binding protein